MRCIFKISVLSERESLKSERMNLQKKTKGCTRLWLDSENGPLIRQGNTGILLFQHPKHWDSGYTPTTPEFCDF